MGDANDLMYELLRRDVGLLTAQSSVELGSGLPRCEGPCLVRQLHVTHIVQPGCSSPTQPQPSPPLLPLSDLTRAKRLRCLVPVSPTYISGLPFEKDLSGEKEH